MDRMSPSLPVSESDQAHARATGFSECVIALRRALTTTPVGWLLAVWFCWGIVPQTSMMSWLGTAAVVWASSLWALQGVIKDGSRYERYARRVHWVAGLDGFAWGLMIWFLMGHDPILDATLIALLCGVIAVNAQVYATYTMAFYRQIGTIWIVSLFGFLLHVTDQKSATDYAAGITVFIALIVYYTREISKRLLEGIRLQRANASLAERLRVALQKVELDAATDALTGQGNRRALDELLKQQAELFISSGKSFSILMLDIDFFKTINDRFGHMIGDDVLRAFVQRVREYLRPGDVCARFGGEEFVVVLPRTSLEEAREVAERLRLGVAQSPLLQDPSLHVTVSIGVASLAPNQTVGDLLATADASVYAAKNAGRNQVHP
ncbi:diguanylate cyclase [Massilia sp. LjRoot122]|uniref:GGDEF domain-containing protein n=1 Tax=Massilia sp. LjRoot122 TaxID=3342257 RepID=UPI003ECDA2C0